jgi:hypothetical protein
MRRPSRIAHGPAVYQPENTRTHAHTGAKRRLGPLNCSPSTLSPEPLRDELGYENTFLFSALLSIYPRESTIAPADPM